MNSLQAAAIVEGYHNDQPTRKEYWQAWAFMIRNGVHRRGGFYGRTARSLINRGCVGEDGTLNWGAIDLQFPEHLEDNAELN